MKTSKTSKYRRRTGPDTQTLDKPTNALPARYQCATSAPINRATSTLPARYQRATSTLPVRTSRATNALPDQTRYQCATSALPDAHPGPSTPKHVKNDFIAKNAKQYKTYIK